MFKHSILFLILVFFNTLVFAQQSQVPNDKMQRLIEARKANYPDLPMQVIAKHGEQHTFMSPGGRYLITGVIKDLWDGTPETGTISEILPDLPTYIDAKDYFLEFGKGADKVDVFISFSCESCLQTIQALFSDKNLNKYTFSVLPVANNPTDIVMLEQLYCRTDKHDFFKRVFLNRDMRDVVQQGCPKMQTSMNNALAKALSVRALPLVHKRSEALTIIGNATDYL